MDPIAVSDESKSKLDAFRFERCANKSFDDAQDRGAIEDKENDPTVHDQDGNSLSQPESNMQNLSQKSASRDVRECPQTPIGRLPLSELIASTEDINGQGLNTTPVERVLWDHSQQAETSSSQAARARKRRYSSSPVSSSQNKTSINFDAGKSSINLQTLQKLLKTPKADPAADLWSRYSLNTDPNSGRLSPTGSAGASCALQISSPQTPAKHLQTKDFGGLRRSISCGMEWPTSVSKRQKIKRSGTYREKNLGSAVPDSGRDEIGKSKLARVSLLVEEIQKRLARPDVSHAEEFVGPSSSSPLPDKVDFSTTSVMPPLPHFLTGGVHLASEPHHATAASLNEGRHQPLRNALKSRTEQSEIQEDSPSSDFDDDDLDLTMLENIEEIANIDQSVPGLLAEPPHRSSSDYGLSSSQPECTTNALDPRTEGHEKPTFQHVNSGKQQESQSAAILASLHPCAAVAESNWDEFDEFDEVDNDTFAADLEDAAAMYDIKPPNHVEQAINLGRHSECPRNSQSREKPFSSVTEEEKVVQGAAQVEVLSDDEFGGDVDFEEIVAKCEEASQKPPLASQFQSSVRSALFGPSL